MNKTQLVDALAARIGDRRTASAVVDGLIETIVDTVRAGGSVSLSGFGVFESRARAARTARNPRTGEAVQVAATTVPAFRPGLAFRTAVGDAAGPPARTSATRRTRNAAPSAAIEAAAVADAPAKVARGR
jgi:DNA-binding protein HU-beta